MKLDEYIEQRITELNNMRDYWKLKNAEWPENYPMEMDDGYWFEQEIAYAEMVGGYE